MNTWAIVISIVVISFSISAHPSIKASESELVSFALLDDNFFYLFIYVHFVYIRRKMKNFRKERMPT